jgi:putative SOS response-associated peptidase YedK
MGLLPASTPDPAKFNTSTTINARAENILTKGIWSWPLKHTRCLVPLDGFYEWLKQPSAPQPSPAEPTARTLFGDALVAANEKRKKQLLQRNLYTLFT